MNHITLSELNAAVRRHYAAGIPALFVVARDPDVAHGEIQVACRQDFQVWTWGAARPLVATVAARMPQEFRAPAGWSDLPAAVSLDWPEPTLGLVMGAPLTQPGFADVARAVAHRVQLYAQNLTIVFLTTETPGPEYGSIGPTLAIDPPNFTERIWHIRHVHQRNNRPDPDPAVLAEVSQALAGLEGTEVQQITLLQLATGGLDARAAAIEKAHRLSAGGLLEVIEPDPAGLAGVGGLDGLKTWLTHRRAAFTPAAADFGLPQPKGVLLVGPPGTGKSLSARAIAANWNFPLIRLDFGRLQGSYVGESEKNLRAVLAQLSGMAPCVCWTDEIEKGLAGSGASSGGEIARRMLSTLLTWMQEQQGVFWFATANDVTALPPELMRKGRFDDTFVLDLPDPEERAAIWTIHLAKRRRNPADFDLPALVAATEGFSGAEIEAAVIDGLHLAFSDGARALATADLLAAAADTRPLSKLAPEAIDAVRQWGATHARPAGKDPRRMRGPQVERLQA